MRRTLALASAVVALTAPHRPLAAQEHGAAALGELVEGLPVSVRVLVIGAHPDDEDNRLLAWLTHAHHVDVAYLSLTRGDGGQNLIGDELGEALGVIRTEELLAARRVDGAHQYFTRAYDFGFSKTSAESFAHWPHDSVLTDVITVIRAYRPQVIISVFSGTPRDGHGQHQVAGIVAREAFDAASDSVRFPRAATAGYGPWTALKFYRTTTYWRGEGATFTYDPGTYDPLLGETYAALGAQSRSQHKSQGQGTLAPLGPVAGSVRREVSRVNAPSDPSREHSIFDGIDTTWRRLEPDVPSGDRALVDQLVRAAAGVRGAVSLYDPAAGVGALERVRALLTRLLDGARNARGSGAADARESLTDGLARATRAELLARGIAIDADAERDQVAQGDSVPVIVTVYDGGSASVRVDRPAVAQAGAGRGAGSAPGGASATVRPDSAFTETVWVHGDSLSQPWWLVTPRHGDMFTVPVDGRSDDVRDQGPTVRVSLEGGALVTDVPVVRRYADPVRGEVRRPVMTVPPIAITLDGTLELARANAPIARTVRAHVVSAIRAPRDVTVTLQLPSGLEADSSSRTVHLDGYGAAATLAFGVRGQLGAGHHEIAAVANSGGRTFTIGYQAIEYDHIRPQKLYRRAALDIEAVDVAVPANLAVAYVRGVGDNVAPALEQLGIPVTMLDPAHLATADLSPYTTIVIGTRAYAAHPELVAANARLLDWVRRGGTLVVQYGQYEMTRPGIMPYSITLARPAARVTDETAAVRVLLPSDSLLTWPNRIGDADWAGWVQERSLYMPSTFDSHYTAPLSMNDPNEPANSGAILEASYGDGTYIYTTLSLFRQLPAGVPGGVRLMANLLAAGRAPHEPARGAPAR